MVAQLEAAETELAAYRDANLVSVIGRNAYVAGLTERARAVEDARRELQAHHETKCQRTTARRPSRGLADADDRGAANYSYRGDRPTSPSAAATVPVRVRPPASAS
jgi:hypothetical protein